jgi:hypothetical protein
MDDESLCPVSPNHASELIVLRNINNNISVKQNMQTLGEKF